MNFFKEFSCPKTTKKVLIHVHLEILEQNFWVVLVNFRLIYGNEDLVIFEKFHDPGPAKKFKKFGKPKKKNFFLETTKKVLIHVGKNHFG